MGSILYLLSLQPLLEPVEVIVAPPEAAQGGRGVDCLARNGSRVSPVSEPPRFTSPETRSHPDKLRTPARTGVEQLQNQNPTQTSLKNAPNTPHPSTGGRGPTTHTADGAHAETALLFAEVISNTPHRY